MQGLWLASFAAGLLLQLSVIRALSQRAWREFFLVFVYVIAMLLASVAQAASFFSFGTPAGSPLHYAAYYWITDGILQVLVLGVVLSLVRRSAERRPAGIVTSRALAASALIVALVSFAAYGDRNLNTRMSLVARNIGFLAVLANLVLWAFLIRRRHPDRTVLLLSGGLGVEMAGKAIGHSLRTLAPSLVTVGNLVIVISYLFGLYVWWQAFRHWQPDPPPLSG